MSDITLDHFKRATADIGVHGDNDTLPFDIDNRFIAENQDALAERIQLQSGLNGQQEQRQESDRFAADFLRATSRADRAVRVPHHHQNPSVLEYLFQWPGYLRHFLI